MNWPELKALIESYGGRIEGGINWTWARFADDAKGRECFAVVRPHINEDRGYYPAQPDDPNSNLHQGGFRFR